MATIVILFNSCKKDVLNTTVSGVVLNKKTGQPLANVKVELLELKVYTLNILGGVSPPDTLDRFSTYTNNEGKYSFKQRLSNNKKANDKNAFFSPPEIGYSLYVNTENYYKYNQKIKGTSGIKKKFDVNLELVPHTFIKYKYKNITPYDNDDKLQLLGLTVIGKNVEGITNSFFCELSIGNDDLSKYIINWNVTKNSIFNRYKKTINCNIGDTTLVEINY